jgi:hypothetical protein
MRGIGWISFSEVGHHLSEEERRDGLNTEQWTWTLPMPMPMPIALGLVGNFAPMEKSEQ